MMRRLAPLGLVAAMLVGGMACGPVTSTMTLNDADVAVQMARLEGAEEYATYEFVSAVEYLAKAKEEWGYSDYQHAESYAERALDFARAARERTAANPDRPLRGRTRGSDDDLDD